jgi:hypothetical protein
MTPEEVRQIIREEIESILGNRAIIPFSVEQAFRDRLRINTYTPLTTSSKSASSENQAVNEAGSASYNVLKAPDGFVEVVIAGQIYYMPYFS